MMLKADTIRAAIVELPDKVEEYDEALYKVLPILKKIAEAASGWKFWLGWGMAALIGAIEGYLRAKGYPV